METEPCLDTRISAIATVKVTSGRALIFAPDWECSEAGVVFDSNSGDYWVVSSLSAMVLRKLSIEETSTMLALNMALRDTSRDADLTAALYETVQSLIGYDLVTLLDPPFGAVAATGRAPA